MEYETTKEIINEPGGEELIPEEMDTHSTLPTQVAIRKASYRDYKPITSVDNTGSIHFVIQLDDCEYLDCQHTTLWLTRKILDKNGDTIPQTLVDPPQPEGGTRTGRRNGLADVLFVNGASSCFKNLEVKINGTVVDLGDGMYAHRADLETRLGFSKEVKKGMAGMGGFIEEQVAFDNVKEDIDLRAPNPNERIEGLVRRFEKSKYSEPWTTVNLIHSPIFQQIKYLPPGTKLELRFDRNEPDFMLLSKAAERTKYTVSLQECLALVTLQTKGTCPSQTFFQGKITFLEGFFLDS